jgi:hypothetical protein
MVFFHKCVLLKLEFGMLRYTKSINWFIIIIVVVVVVVVCLFHTVGLEPLVM